MSNQELIYVFKSLSISYIPVLLLLLGVDYAFFKLFNFTQRSLPDSMVFTAVVIILLSYINLWNKQKRRPALLKEDETEPVRLQILMNTLISIIFSTIVLTLFKSIGNYLIGIYKVELNFTSDLYVFIAFLGLIAIITMYKKLKEIR
jgi:hypothetical protein